MKRKSVLQNWYDKPVTPLLALSALVLYCLTAILRTELGGNSRSVGNSFSIITEHYGISSEEIERGISIPIEQSISSLSGIQEIRSSSEYSRSRVDIHLHEDRERTEFYLELRERIDRIYASMPKSVQKPRIVSSSSSQAPSFIISFSSQILDPIDLRSFVEHRIKPRYEKIEGTGEVEIGGGALKEIHMQVDEEKMTRLGQNSAQLASLIQKQNIYTALGIIHKAQTDVPVSFDGRIKTHSEIKNLQIPSFSGQNVELQSIAEISFASREADSISRVQGEQKVTLYIKSGGKANIVSLSKSIREETQVWQSEGLTCDIIYDQGQQMSTSINEVLISLIIGMLVVGLFIILTTGNLRQSLILCLSLPLTAAVATGILNIFDISIDTSILAGMAIATGIIIDSGIILCETIKKPGNTIYSVLPALITSTLSSVIVLLPLLFNGDAIGNIAAVSLTLVLMLVTSLLLNILFIPVFFKDGGRKLLSITFPKEVKKFFISIAYRSYKSAGFILVMSAALLVLALIILLQSGSRFDSIPNANVIFAHVEMESAASLNSVDQRLNGFISRLIKHPHIIKVESMSRRGNGQLTISYDARKTKQKVLEEWIKKTALSIPRTSLFIPEESDDKTTRVELTLSGSNNTTLREIAKLTLKELTQQPWVSDAVLHFKEAPPSYSFHVDHNQFPRTALSAQDIAHRFRWNLQGPVADKWFENGDEIDIRIMGKEKKERSLEDLRELPFSNRNYNGVIMKAGQLGWFSRDSEAVRIYRSGQQRSIHFSIDIEDLNLEQITENVWQVLNKQNLPEGYAFKMDQNLFRQKKKMTRLWIFFALALFLVYAVLAGESESFRRPLLIMLFIPISLAFPIIALKVIGEGLTTYALVGFIVLCGMVVNNAILILDDCRFNENRAVGRIILSAIGRRLKPLLLTSGTTILGTAALLFINMGEFNFLNALAFIMFFGISGSLYASLVFLPAFVRVWGKWI